MGKNTITETIDLDKLLGKIADDTARTAAIKNGLKADGNAVLKVARQKVAFNPARKETARGRHLRKSLGQKFKKYRSFHVQIVGPKTHKPFFAFHTHFIELGLKAGGFVRHLKANKKYGFIKPKSNIEYGYNRNTQPPRPFIEPAIRVTASGRTARISKPIIDFIKKVGG